MTNSSVFLHTVYMATSKKLSASKKKTGKKAPSKKGMFDGLTWHFFVPGAVGGGIALVFGGGLVLALQVFVVVVVSTWIIRKYA